MISNCKNNLWILTEERPKNNVLVMIFKYFAKDYGLSFFADNIRIIPILDTNKCFSFTYEVMGFKCSKIEKIYIKIISGKSSFTDFLIYYQPNMPTIQDEPIYAIEETKTDDSESRNTGVYQRCSKFVFLKNFYPNTKEIMLYSLQISEKQKPSQTNIFGTRLLLTYGVEILGKNLDQQIYTPFKTIDELISYKNGMRKPPTGNVPILIKQYKDKIQISGRLYKAGRLSHDPNIGALSMISAVLRKLGWNKTIEITHHGLTKYNVGTNNKFLFIAQMLNISLEKINMPKSILPKIYWKYDTNGEKLATIFIHIVVENFTSGFSVFENHAGCEKGYFIINKGEHIPLAKYTDREAYKRGDKNKIVNIPDLVLIDINEYEAITIEGKQYKNVFIGIKELDNYDAFEKMYLDKYYPKYKIIRTVVLYGGIKEQIVEVEVGFLLNQTGKLILGVKAPKLFIEAITNLLSYW